MNVTCSTYIDAAEYILRALKTRDASPDTNHIVIVPDKYTLAAERFYMAGLGGSGSFDVSVMTLDRIMHRIAPKGKYITAHAAAMAVRRIARECAMAGELQCFRGTLLKGAFGAEMYKTIAQLKSCRVGTGARGRQVCNIADGVSDGRIMRKLNDIGVIYRKYNEFLDGAGLKDASDRMEVLIDCLGESEYIASSYFYILGFDSVTPQAAEAFRGLERYSKAVIHTVVDVSHAEIESGDGVFATALSKEQASFWAHLRDNYLKYPYMPYQPEAPIEVYKAADRQDMLEAAALKIKQCVERGYRYGDIAVVGKLDYADTEVFAEAGIEFNFDHHEPLAFHPAVRLITDILKAAVTNYHGGIADIAKNPLSGIEYGAAQVFENYCLKYNITYRVDEPFYAHSAKDTSTQKIAEAVRSKLYGVMGKFVKAFRECEKTEDYLGAVSELIANLKLEERCADYAGSCEEAYRPFAVQAYDKLMSVLNDAWVLQGYKAGKQEFCDLLNAGLGAVEMAAVPHKVNAVDIAELGAYRFGRYKTVIYLDASERLFPSVSKDGGILLDSELDRMGDTGRRIIPKIRDINIREKALTVRSFFLGEELVFMYPYEAGGEPVKEAYLLSRLREVFPRHGYTDYKAERAAYSSVSGLWEDGYIRGVPSNAAGARKFFKEYNRAKNGLAETVSEPVAALKEVFVEGGDLGRERECAVPQRAEELFFYGGVSSVSRFESYFDCPYRHFVRYGLRVKDREQGGNADAIRVGNILHKFLERFSLKAALCHNPEEEALNIIGEIKAEPDMTDTDRNIADKLIQEAQAIAVELCAQAARSEFVTAATEAEFGEGKQYSGVTVCAPDGRSIILAGKIDRIDTLKDYVRIVDYKTGTVKRGWENIYYGRDIQLFVYMGALVESGHKPAAILYFPVSNDYRKAGVKRYMMQGYLNGDLGLLRAGDSDIADKGYSDMLPVRLKRDGTPDVHTQRFLLSGEEFSAALEYCKNLIGTAAGEIADGYIAPAPAQGVCDYCEYRGVCVPHNKSERRLIKGADKSAVTGMGDTDGDGVYSEVAYDE